MANKEVIDAVVGRSTEQLFAAYGVPLEAEHEVEQAEQDDVRYVGIIGFTGNRMRGTLLVAPDSALLERSNPIAGSPPRDWIEELANQLLGRIKNQLLQYDVECYLTTPLVIKGLQLQPARRTEPLLYRFRTAGAGCLTVWFDVEIAEGVELVAFAGEQVHAEGDALMF